MKINYILSFLKTDSMSSQSTNLICISDFLSQKLHNPLLRRIMHILIPLSLQNQRILKIFTQRMLLGIFNVQYILNIENHEL